MKPVGVHQRHRVNMWGQTERIKVVFPVPRCKPGTNLSWGSRRGSGGGAGAILQGEVSDEDNELGKCPTDLSARALKQVLREPVRISKQNVVCKPVAYILTVSQQDAKGIIPRGENKINMCKQGQEHLRGKKKEKRNSKAHQSLAGPRTTFLVWKPVLKRNLAASWALIIAISSASGKRWSCPKRKSSGYQNKENIPCNCS